MCIRDRTYNADTAPKAKAAVVIQACLAENGMIANVEIGETGPVTYSLNSCISKSVLENIIKIIYSGIHIPYENITPVCLQIILSKYT